MDLKVYQMKNLVWRKDSFSLQNFWSYKDWPLQLSCISLQSSDIWICLMWKQLHYTSHCEMTFWESNSFEIISLNHSVVYWVICCGYIHTHEQFQVTLFDNIRDIPDFPKSHYAVWRMRWSYLDIKQIKISQDWNEIRDNPTAVKTNLYNFKS